MLRLLPHHRALRVAPCGVSCTTDTVNVIHGYSQSTEEKIRDSSMVIAEIGESGKTSAQVIREKDPERYFSNQMLAWLFTQTNQPRSLVNIEVAREMRPMTIFWIERSFPICRSRDSIYSWTAFVVRKDYPVTNDPLPVCVSGYWFAQEIVESCEMWRFLPRWSVEAMQEARVASSVHLYPPHKNVESLEEERTIYCREVRLTGILAHRHQSEPDYPHESQ